MTVEEQLDRIEQKVDLLSADTIDQELLDLWPEGNMLLAQTTLSDYSLLSMEALNWGNKVQLRIQVNGALVLWTRTLLGRPRPT